MGKAAESERDLACQWVTFVTPDDSYRLINTSRNIAEVGQLMFPILVGRALPFGEMLDWIQFVYTADRTRAYVAPAPTVLVLSEVSEGYPLFPAF